MNLKRGGTETGNRFLSLRIQVANLYYKMFQNVMDLGSGPSAEGPLPAAQLVPRPAREACKSRDCYLMPVVAMPLMRNRWPKRNTRKTGRSDTMDIANSDPQLVADCESTKARSATGTVNMSGSVR